MSIFKSVAILYMTAREMFYRLRGFLLLLLVVLGGFTFYEYALFANERGLDDVLQYFFINLAGMFGSDRSGFAVENKTDLLTVQALNMVFVIVIMLLWQICSLLSWQTPMKRSRPRPKLGGATSFIILSRIGSCSAI